MIPLTNRCDDYIDRPNWTKKPFEYIVPPPTEDGRNNKIKCTLTALDETENNLVSMGHTQQTRGQEDLSYEQEQEQMDQNLGMGQTQETKIWVIAQ